MCSRRLDTRMSTLTAESKLELEVADFGPIIEAKLDLRPLTVFVGPSNTGKSYLAVLLYALHRSFNGSAAVPTLPRFEWDSRLCFSRATPHTRRIRQEVINSLTIFFEKNYNKDGKLRTDNILTIDGTMLTLIYGQFNWGGFSLNSELERCLGIDRCKSLIRDGSKRNVWISVRCASTQESQLRGSVLRTEGEGIKTRIENMGRIKIRLEKEEQQDLNRHFRQVSVGDFISELARGEGNNALLSGFLYYLSNLVFPHMFRPLHAPAFYLPAGRVGVMHTYNAVVSALLESASRAVERPDRRGPLLSGVLSDFLQHLIGIDSTPHGEGKFQHNLATRIEGTVLGGAIRAERSRSGANPSLVYHPEGWRGKLPLINASSMVVELAPVVLFLRHRLEYGNVLILEEPESHLHPAMQVILVEQLATLVRAGIRVVLTTHSEWVLEGLANIVRRSEVPEETRKQELGDDVALTAGEVGIWLFQKKRRPRGAVVKEIQLGESGLYPAGFEEVAATLHNDWAEISSQIREAE